MKFPSAAEDVTSEVFHVVDIGQSVYEQRYRQYKKILKEVPDDIVFVGLIDVFSNTSRGVRHYQQQKVAGALLVELVPKVNQTLEAILRATLENYNLSIEELPIFLAKQFGTEELLKQLAFVQQQNKNPAIAEAARGFEFWLKK